MARKLLVHVAVSLFIFYCAGGEALPNTDSTDRVFAAGPTDNSSCRNSGEGVYVCRVSTGLREGTNSPKPLSGEGWVETNKGPRKTEYAPGEVLVGLTEGADIDNILTDMNIRPEALCRIHDIKPAAAKFRKGYKIKKDSDGWYWFLGKNYESVEDIPDEEMFKEACRRMTPAERTLYRSYKIILPEDMSVEEAIEKLQKNPDVRYAEPNYLTRLHTAPDDPYYHTSGSWGQDYDDLWGIKRVRCEGAWEVSKGEDVIVAVIDTGIDYLHEDLQKNIWINEAEYLNSGVDDDGNGYIDDIRGWDFSGDGKLSGPDNDPMDYDGHGTHCAGIVAAAGDNGRGVIGVAPKAKIMALKIFPLSYYSVVAKAIKYAADNGAHILSCSWGTYQQTAPTIEDALDYAYEKGCTAVFSAGNEDVDAGGYFPANYPRGITVAAVDHNGERADFSNYGPSVDVSAPGVEILSLRAGGTDMYMSSGDHFVPAFDPDAKYYRASGTSMSCPFVSGAAALIKSAHPNFTNEDIIRTLPSAVSSPKPCSKYIGTGIIDAEKAVGIETPVTAAAAITYPQYNDIFGKSHIPIRGTVTGSDYKVECSQTGFYAGDWLPLQNDGNPDDDVLAYFDANLLDGGRVYAQLAASDDSGGKAYSATSFLINSYIHPGWPLNTGGIIESSAISADIDSDGENEIVFASHDRRIYVCGLDGSVKEGWPKTVGGEGIRTALAAADMDNDGSLEIVASCTDGRVYAWHYDGSPLSGWPVTMRPRGYPSYCESSPAIGDIDNDGDLEVVVGCSQNAVYAWHHDGTIVSGWPFNFSDPVYASPALADLDGDGDLEIIIGSYKGSSAGCTITALHHDGTIMAGWENKRSGFLSASPAIGDIDNDGDLEVVASVNILGLHSGVTIFAWHHDGTPVSGSWPFDTGCHNSIIYVNEPSPSLADLDGGDDLEIVVADFKGHVFALKHDGTLLPGWPNTTNSYVTSTPVIGDIDGDGRPDVIMPGYEDGAYRLFAWRADGSPVDDIKKMTVMGDYTYATPFLGDIDNDGRCEILIGANDDKMHLWDLPGTYAAETAQWPMFGYNLRNTRFYTRFNRPPALKHIGSITAAEGGLLKFRLTAADPDGDPLTYSAYNLPAEAGFDTHTGEFSWVVKHSTEIVFTVSDGELTDSESVTITAGVDEVGIIRYDPYFPPHYTHRLYTEDRQIILANIGYDLTMYQDAKVRLKGTMQAGIHYPLKWLYVLISDINRAPMFSLMDMETRQGKTLQFNIYANDPEGDPVTYSADNLPAGATFNPQTRIFRWPTTFNTEPGVYNVTFTASDGSSSNSAIVKITVRPNARPEITEPEDMSQFEVDAGEDISFLVKARDTDLTPPRLEARALPQGATFNSVAPGPGWTVKEFKWRPEPKQFQSKPYKIIFDAYDSDADLLDSQDQAVVYIKVNVLNQPPEMLYLSKIWNRWFIWLGRDHEDGYYKIRYSYKVDDGQWSGPAGRTWINIEDISGGLEEGVHTFYVKAIDTGGAESEIKSADFVVSQKNQPPDMLYLKNSSNVQLLWLGRDQEDGYGIRYTYKIDGGQWSGPAGRTWVDIKDISGGLSEGTHTFYVKAVDTKGAESEAKSVEFVVSKENHAPKMLYVSNIWNRWLLWFGLDQEDRYRIMYSYKIDSGGWSSPTSRTLMGIGEVSAGLQPGTHTLSVKAIDTEGAESEPKSTNFNV